jgi:hypothetical protein
MQPLNHDMDDLMRRAAESYPVIPQGADWEKVAQQLEAAESLAPPGQKYGGLKKLLLLLPFILASFVCDKFFTMKQGTLQTLETAASGLVPDVVANPVHQTKPLKKTSQVAVQNQFIRKAEAPQLLQQPQPELLEGGLVTKVPKQESTMSVLKSLPFAAGGRPVYDLLAVSNPETEAVLQKVQHVILPETVSPGMAKHNTLKKQQNVPLEKGYVSLLLGPDFIASDFWRVIISISVGALKRVFSGTRKIIIPTENILKRTRFTCRSIPK